MSNLPSQLDPQTAREVALAEVQIDFITAIADARLKAAQADEQEALAKQDLATAAMKQEMAKQLSAAYQRLTAHRRDLELQIQEAVGRWQAVHLIVDGENIAHSACPRLWTAVRRLLRDTMDTNTSKIDYLQGVLYTADDLNPSNWADRSVEQNTVRRHPLPASPANGVQLLSYLASAWFLMPRAGTHPWQLTVQSLGVLAGYCQDEITKMQQAIKDLEAGTYDVWKPIDFATLTTHPNTDVKSVAMIGATK